MTRRAAAPPHGSTDLSLALSESSGPSHTLLRTFDASLPADGTIAPSHPRTRSALLVAALALAALALTASPAIAAGDANEPFCPAATESSPGFRSYLPDCRAYEQVTPPDKAGSVISPQPATVAAAGSSLAGVTSGAFAGLENDELPAQGVASYRFARTGSGWMTTPLQIFQGRRQSIGVSDSVWAPAYELGGVQHLSLRRPDGSLSDIGPIWPPAFGTVSPSSYALQGAASDASHGIVFRTEEPIPKWPFDTTVTGASLYEYVGTNNSEPTLVGVSGSAGSTMLVSQCGTSLGASSHVHFGSEYNAVSESGHTVFFTANGEAGSLSSAPTSDWASSSTCTHGVATGTAPPTSELYARLGGAQTVWVSEPQCTPTSTCSNVSTEPYTTEESALAAEVYFEGAAADGSRVYFTTTQQLINSDTDTTRDLYEYDSGAPPGQRLIQVSVGGSGDATPGSGASVEGVSRISEDGSHVYFVADGVLTTAPNSKGESAQTGANNLYVDEPDPAHPGQYQTVFIAELCSGAETSGGVPDAQCPSDLNSEPWNYGSNRNDQGLWSHGADGGDTRPIQATPDGTSLVFTSYGDLTQGDTSTARQVFEYDAHTDKLARVSIGESGFNNNGNASAGNASIVTPPYNQPEAGWTRGGALARTVSDDGSEVFFESPVGLTPQALDHAAIDDEGNLAQNIYEYHQGHVYLISDGRDTSLVPRVSGNVQQSAVFLAGTSSSGDNVFFTTVDPLVPQDTDTQVDIYDARIGGGFPPPTAATPCGGETCKPPASQPPAEPGAGSSTFSGPGNRPPAAKCRKGFVRKHGKCVKKHHKRRHHHKRASTNRRASR